MDITKVRSEFGLRFSLLQLPGSATKVEDDGLEIAKYFNMAGDELGTFMDLSALPIAGTERQCDLLELAERRLQFGRQRICPGYRGHRSFLVTIGRIRFRDPDRL